MALGTARLEDGLALIRQPAIDFPGKIRRFGLGDKIFEPLIALDKALPRQRPDANRRGRDYRTEGLRLAGRVVELSLAAAEAPDGREIGITGRFVPGRLGQDVFWQVEGVVATGTPSRLAVHPAELSLDEVQRFAGRRDQHRGVVSAVDPVEREVHADFR